MKNTGGKSHPAMEIRISGLADGEYSFDFQTPASELGLDAFEGDVDVRGTLRRVANQIFLNSTVRGLFLGECDRCLAETRQELEVPMNLYYHIVVAGERPQAGGEDPEIRTFHPDQDSIVLDDEVRQTLLLEVPLKTLCSDDCKGLCPGCGVDLNREECRCEGAEIDPRWAKLAEVFRNGGKE